MTGIKVIVFGPTGGVGSAAALAAQQRGAKVILAMRNPKKPVPGLSPEYEREAGFERVQADLAQPDTVHAAVSVTGAKRAFIYLVPNAPGNMRSTVAALKSAGIEFVVFLSTFTIRSDQDLRSIPPDDAITWGHAQVEIALNDIFGPSGSVAVRPGYFATNTFRFKEMVRQGEVKIPYPDLKWDWITPWDIGAVSGALLVKGSQALEGVGKQTAVPILGPQFVSERDAVGIIGRVIGKEVKVTQVSREEGLEILRGRGIPESVAENLLSVMGKLAEGELLTPEYSPDNAKAVGSVLKYTGKEPTTLQEWAEENKQEFGP